MIQFYIKNICTQEHISLIREEFILSNLSKLMSHV